MSINLKQQTDHYVLLKLTKIIMHKFEWAFKKEGGMDGIGKKSSNAGAVIFGTIFRKFTMSFLILYFFLLKSVLIVIVITKLSMKSRGKMYNFYEKKSFIKMKCENHYSICGGYERIKTPYEHHSCCHS